MQKLLVAAALTAALVTLQPAKSHAFWNSPQNSQGYTWLQGKALNFLSFTHFHGPLYNYGPYYGPGYQWMFVANPWCGAYVTALPTSAYGGYKVAPWSNFNNLPYPRTPAGGVGWAPAPPTPPGAPPLADGQPPVVTAPASDTPSIPVAPKATTPGAPSPKPSKMPSSTKSDSYYGGPVPEYFKTNR